MRQQDLPGSGAGPQLLSQRDSRGGDRSLLLLLRSHPLLFRSSNLSSFLCSLVTSPLSFPASKFCDVQLLLGLGGDGGTLAQLNLVDLRLALEVPDLPLEVHDPLPDVLGNVHSRRFVGGVSA